MNCADHICMYVWNSELALDERGWNMYIEKYLCIYFFTYLSKCLYKYIYIYYTFIYSATYAFTLFFSKILCMNLFAIFLCVYVPIHLCTQFVFYIH